MRLLGERLLQSTLVIGTTLYKDPFTVTTNDKNPQSVSYAECYI